MARGLQSHSFHGLVRLLGLLGLLGLRGLLGLGWGPPHELALFEF